MYYIDSHCHIYKGACEDIDNVIKTAVNDGVKKMINCSENIKTSTEIIKLSKKYKGILYSAVGIHPEYTDETDEKDLLKMEEIIKENKVTAIGEIGLDYHFTKENKVQQIELFKKQLFLAEKYNLPVIIHSRDATNDTIEILKKFNVTGVIHSFSGSYEVAQEYIKLGFFLGINGVVTFKNSKLKDVLEKLKLDNIILETDSPFLSPHPYRGKINSPKNIVVIGNFLANLLNISDEDVMEITTRNVEAIFDI